MGTRNNTHDIDSRLLRLFSDVSLSSLSVDTATDGDGSASVHHQNGIQPSPPPSHLIARNAHAAGQYYPIPGHHGQPYYPQYGLHQSNHTPSPIQSQAYIGSHLTAVHHYTQSPNAGYQCYSLNGSVTASVGQQQVYHKGTLVTQHIYQNQQPPYQQHLGHFPYQPIHGQLDSSRHPSTQRSSGDISNDRLCHSSTVPPQQQPFNASDGSHFYTTARSSAEGKERMKHPYYLFIDVFLGMRVRATAIGGVAFRPSNTETRRPPSHSSLCNSPSTASLCF